MKPNKTILTCLCISFLFFNNCKKDESGDSGATSFTIDFSLSFPTPAQTEVPSEVKFEWSKSALAVKYELHYGLTPDANDVLVSNLTTNSHTLSELTFGATYYWKVVGIDGEGRKASTVIWQFQIKENYFLLSSAFEIPQLDKTTAIWIYLPPDYETSTKRYPVVYLFDGQLMFYPNVGPTVGEWEVDESLDLLFKESGFAMIAVAIYSSNNHAGERCDDYLAWVVSNQIEVICRDASGPHGGDAGKYSEFLVQTLKPYIDNNYRTFPDESNTCIIGAQLGGVMALYASLEYPSIFGKIGVFSPAFWFTQGKIYELAAEKASEFEHQKMFFVSGTQNIEEFDIPTDVNRMIDTLNQQGFLNIGMASFPYGNHPLNHRFGTTFWGEAFPRAIEWLFDE